jgi:uncharacterized membrane protein (UPF0127 family)
MTHFSPILLVFALIFTACNGQQARKRESSTDAAIAQQNDTSMGHPGKKTIGVELVDERFEISRGLMCRRSMARDWGMLFFMPEARVQSFWMKNTLIPLDMVFISDAWTVVGVVANAQPLTRSPRGVNASSSYVLELNAGAAERLGIVKGTELTLVPPEGASRDHTNAQCRSDADCTSNWIPSSESCGSIERCFGGKCIEPPAVTGQANTETAGLTF